MADDPKPDEAPSHIRLPSAKEIAEAKRAEALAMYFRGGGGELDYLDPRSAAREADDEIERRRRR
jgi:hypothetical protein